VCVLKLDEICLFGSASARVADLILIGACVAHLSKEELLARSKDCVYTRPQSLDEYALGVVIYEYIASHVEGVPVVRAGEPVAAAGGGGAVSAQDCFWQSAPNKVCLAAACCLPVVMFLCLAHDAWRGR
jgi:hypothetical protein